MNPEIAAGDATPARDAREEKPTCEKCGSLAISITPVPGRWLQYSCDDCDHWWWETQDGDRISPAT